MSLDYETAYAASTPEPPFSNGTEYYDWSARWCDNCAQEDEFIRSGKGLGCPLLMVALLGRTPVEWREGDSLARWRHDYYCTEFVDTGRYP